MRIWIFSLRSKNQVYFKDEQSFDINRNKLLSFVLTPCSGGGHWVSIVMGEKWVNELLAFLDSGNSPIRVTLVGVGNPIKGDDSAGVYVASQLRRRYGANPNKHVHITIECAPERIFSNLSKKTAKRNEAILIIDSVEANLDPGSIIFASLVDTRYGFFATHNIPPRIFSDFLPSHSNIFVIGIQPENLEIGEGLSSTVRTSADRIIQRVSDSIDRMEAEN
jgi:hydrogenase 3 maturation protease